MISFWWKVFINDKEITDDPDNRRSCITGLSFSNPIDGSDTVTLSIADPEMKFIEDNIYTDNAPVKVQLGVNESLFVKEFTGFISAIDISLPENDTVTLTLTCMDMGHIMHRTKRKRTWQDTTNSKVVRQIAAEYGFKCEVESGYDFKTEETISQDNKTDLELIEDLASNENEKFYCKLIGDTIYYKKQGLVQDPVVGLTYRAYPYDLISFSPQITIEDKKQNENSDDVNSASRQPASQVVTIDNAKRDSQGSSTPAQSPTPNNNNTTSRGNTEDDKSSSNNSSGGKHVFDPETQSWK